MAGQIFSVDGDVLLRRLDHFRNNQWVNSIMAYLVLVKHQQRGKPCTTSGVLAIPDVLGVTRYRASKLLGKLKKIRLGKKPQEGVFVNHKVLTEHPELDIPPTVGMFHVRGLPQIGTDCIYSPNCLLMECEARIGRKVSTWRKAIAQRTIPFVHLGRSVRIPEEYIEDLIQKGWHDPVVVDA